MSHFSEYHQFDGLGLAELVKTKQVTPTELLDAAIAHIEAYNPTINAVIYKMYEQARIGLNQGVPEGSFQGVPFLLKDLKLMYAGVPTSNGNRLPQCDKKALAIPKVSDVMNCRQLIKARQGDLIFNQCVIILA